MRICVRGSNIASIDLEPKPDMKFYNWAIRRNTPSHAVGSYVK